MMGNMHGINIMQKIQVTYLVSLRLMENIKWNSQMQAILYSPRITDILFSTLRMDWHSSSWEKTLSDISKTPAELPLHKTVMDAGWFTIHRRISYSEIS